MTRAVILAAGRGSRLGALSSDLPKCLLPVCGRPLLDHHLESLAAAGVQDVTVVAGYMAEQVESHVAGRCRVLVNGDWERTNSIVSLQLAAAFLRGAPFLFQNADVLYEPALIRRLVSSPHGNACLVDPLRAWSQDEYHVEIAQGRIIRYSRDVSEGDSSGQSAQLVRIGAADSAAFLDEVCRIVARGDGGGFPNQAYGVLMQGEGLWPVYTAGLSWWEIDTEDDYAGVTSALERPPAEAGVPRAPTIERLGGFVRRPHLPWRLRWVPRIAGSATRQPLRTWRGVRRLGAGRLSVAGLDLQLNGARLLSRALEAARAAGLRPFLLWGSLLGCLREGGFIENDRDIDLGITADQAGRLPAYRTAMMRHGFRVRIENRHKLSMVHPRHPELFIDIDIVRQQGNRWCITNADAVPGRHFHYWFSSEVFAGVMRREFGEGTPVDVPAGAVQFLEQVYGDWRTPQSKLHYLYGPLNVDVERVGNAAPAPAGTPTGVLAAS